MLVVPGRPTSESLTFWVLLEKQTVPTAAVRGVPPAQVLVRSLRTADHPLSARLFLVAVTGLQDDREYLLDVNAGADRHCARSRTLPRALSDAPFTIAFGSCYCRAQDRGIDAAYPPIVHGAASDDPIRLRVLCGDQIYMDMSPSTGGPIVAGTPLPFERYYQQWQGDFASFLSKSPNVMLADDHEYWNDYPHGDMWLTWADSKPTGPLGKRMDRAFELFQATLNLDAAYIRESSRGATPQTALDGSQLERLLATSARNFSFRVDPVAFFVLDVRTRRSRFDASPKPQLCAPEWLERVRQWALALEGPGVLMLSQPLVERRSTGVTRALHVMGDCNLPDYDSDYATLWNALFDAPHDIVVLTGDIHWSRGYVVTRAGRTRPRVWELTASPLALIPGPLAGTGPDTGRVEWLSGSGIYQSYHQSNHPASYTTLTLQRRGPTVVGRAQVWNAPSQRGQGAQPGQQSQLILQ